MSTDSPSPSTQPSNNTAPSDVPSLPGGQEIPDAPDDLSNKNVPEIPPTLIPEGPYGAIVFVDGSHVVVNQPAMVADFCANCDFGYDPESHHHVQFSESSGTWEKKKPEQAMWAITAYVMQLSVRLKLPELVAKCKPSFLNNILKLVEGYAPLGKPPSPFLIPVDNGVIDTSSGSPEFRPFRKEDYFTFKIHVPYVPEAKCRRFLDELVRPVFGEEDEHLLQRDFGRQLLAGNKAQTISLFTGKAGSGKSILILVLEGILGTGRIAHLRSDKLNGNFETHAFHSKSVLVGKDVDPDYLTNKGASTIKSLTGGDWFETEQKYGGKFGMRGTFYVNVTSNSRLLIGLKGDADAWRRRLVLYHVSRQNPPQRVPYFEEVLLREEGSGILNWLLEGCFAHQRELAEHGILRLTEAQQKRVDDLIMESDPAHSFAQKCIKKSKGNLTSAEILKAYVAFAKEHNWTLLSEQVFFTKLRPVLLKLFGGQKGHDIMRNGAAGQGYRGVQFINEEEGAA